MVPLMSVVDIEWPARHAFILCFMLCTLGTEAKEVTRPLTNGTTQQCNFPLAYEANIPRFAG